jgi:hypothetical protein
MPANAPLTHETRPFVTTTMPLMTDGRCPHIGLPATPLPF